MISGRVVVMTAKSPYVLTLRSGSTASANGATSGSNGSAMPRRAKNIVADTGTITIATATSIQFRTRTSAGTAPDRRRAALRGSPAFARGSAGWIRTYTHSARQFRVKNAELAVTA